MPNKRILELRKEMQDYCEPRNNEINEFIYQAWEENQLVSTIAEETGYSEKTIRIKLTYMNIDWRSRPEPEPTSQELKLIY